MKYDVGIVFRGRSGFLEIRMERVFDVIEVSGLAGEALRVFRVFCRLSAPEVRRVADERIGAFDRSAAFGGSPKYQRRAAGGGGLLAAAMGSAGGVGRGLYPGFEWGGAG